MDTTLAYAAGGLVALWGTAHLVPTADVVAGFGEIGIENRRIILMEWVAEGLAMLFIGVMTIAITATVGADEAAGRLVYRISAGGLVGFGAWTAMTAARGPVVWFKICPFVLGTAAAMLVTASLV